MRDENKVQIKSIKLQNYKCWRSLEISDLKKYNVFIVENSIGKSSILSGIIDIISRNVKFNAYTRSTSEIQFLIELSLKYDEIWLNELLQRNGVKLQNNQKSHLLHYFENLKYIIQSKIPFDQSRTANGSTNFNPDISAIDRSFDSVLKNVNLHNYSGTFRNFIRNFVSNHVIHINSRRTIGTEQTGSTYSYEFSLDGNNIKRLLHNAKNSIDRIQIEGFQKFQDIVESWSFTPGKPDIVASSGHEIDLIFRRNDQEPIKIEEIGDGIKEAVIIAGICLCHPEHIFLIEEPERHLHPRALRELRDLFKNEITGQVFITTHSPTFINEMDENSAIYSLMKKDGESIAVPIKQKDDLQEFRTHFGLINSDFLFEDILVFVEGETDQQSFQYWFEILFPYNNSVRFLFIGGKSELPSALILSLMIQLNQNFTFFSIIDSDGEKNHNLKEKLISDLKGRASELVGTFGIEKIEKSIYLLQEKGLENYLTKSPRIISEWLNIELEKAKQYFEQNPSNSFRKLKNFAKTNGIHFKKTKDVPKLLELMKKEDIDPEIQRLLENINNLK